MLVCLQLLLQVAGGSAAQSDTSLELKASVKAAAWFWRDARCGAGDARSGGRALEETRATAVKVMQRTVPLLRCQRTWQGRD